MLNKVGFCPPYYSFGITKYDVYHAATFSKKQTNYMAGRHVHTAEISGKVTPFILYHNYVRCLGGYTCDD